MWNFDKFEKPKRASCAGLPPILMLRPFRKGNILQLPPETWRQQKFAVTPSKRKGFVTLDEICWSLKSKILCETSPNFGIFWAEKHYVPTRFALTLKICYLQSDVSCEDSQKSMPCQKMPGLPQILHFATSSHSQHKAVRSTDAIRHVWGSAPAAKNAATYGQKCYTCHQKHNASFRNNAQVLHLPHKIIVMMLPQPRSAAPAARNKAAWCFFLQNFHSARP